MNKIRTVKKSTKKTSPKTPQQQFNTYCQAMKKQQQRIELLQEQKTKLFARFKQELLPTEQQLVQLVTSTVERLLSFTHRKSLSIAHHGELIDWISEEISFLENHPFAEQTSVAALRERQIAAALPAHTSLDEYAVTYMRSLLASEFDFIHQTSDEELAEMIRDPIKLKRRMDAENQQHQQSIDSDDTDYSFFGDQDTYEQAAEEKQQEQQQINTLFSSSAANRMYKRLAMILHPDRESDEAIKQEKHLLMLTLSKAKKSGDIWVILNLYQQYVSDTDFNTKELEMLIPLLAQRVDALKDQFHHLNSHVDSMESLIWSKLGAATPAGVEKKVAQRHEALQTQIVEETQVFNDLTSLKVLRSHLAARRQSMEWSWEQAILY